MDDPVGVLLEVIEDAQLCAQRIGCKRCRDCVGDFDRVDVVDDAAAADGDHENDDNEDVDNDKNDFENVIWQKPFAGNTFQNNAMRCSVSPSDPWSATVQAKIFR